MKKALTIVTIVAGYTLVETLLLLSLPCQIYRDLEATTYRFAVISGQLLVIPGFAVILSRVMYGPQGWVQRALRILAVGLLVIPGSIMLSVGFALVVEWVTRSNADSLLLQILMNGIGILVVVGIPALSFFFAMKSARNSVPLEAARWLAERQAGTSPEARRWRTRGIRVASCVPCAIVLLVFLFLPEIWGVLSHIRQPRTVNLPGYRISIPASWIILNHGTSWDGRSEVWGMVGNGINFVFKPHLHEDGPLSTWTVGVLPSPQPDRPESHRAQRPAPTTLAERVFTVENQTLTCRETCPFCERQDAHFRLPHYINIECSGAHNLYASMVGERRHVPAFYKMIESIKPIAK